LIACWLGHFALTVNKVKKLPFCYVIMLMEGALALKGNPSKYQAEKIRQIFSGEKSAKVPPRCAALPQEVVTASFWTRVRCHLPAGTSVAHPKNVCAGYPSQKHGFPVVFFRVSLL
jgi:hypothetical protein